MKKKNFVLLSLLLLSIIIALILLIINKKNNSLIILEDNDYKKGELVTLDKETINKKQKNKENFIVYIHIPGLCTSEIPFDPIVNNLIKKEKITIYSLPYNVLKETELNNDIKYSPSLAIIKDGKLKTFLDANSEKDFEYYSSLDGLTKWLKSYVYIK